MKKPNFKKYGSWKDWKRPSFQFYFVLFVTLVVITTVMASGLLSELLEKWVGESVSIPTILVMFIFGLVIGWVLSFFISLFLLKPIRSLQSAMNEVAEGNLDIKVEEKSHFDEIENINHSFNLMTKELNANQLIQKDFISNVSHEFKTPLSTIEGYATLLQDRTLTDDEREEYAKEIVSTTKDMTELVGNILLLSKISNQAIAYQKQEYSLDEQIRKVVVALEPKWSAKNIELNVDFDAVTINSNENLMFNVWRNLIENAIKFSPQGGEIKLSLKNDNGKVIFSVSDQGEGVKEEDKKYIFEKFYQSDTSHKQEGNGLGLALVKNILTIFGGSVSVKNLQPKGCCFTVTL